MEELELDATIISKELKSTEIKPDMTDEQKEYLKKYNDFYEEIKLCFEKINENFKRCDSPKKNKTGIDVIDKLKINIENIQKKRTFDKTLLNIPVNNSNEKESLNSIFYKREIEHYKKLEKERKRVLQNIKQLSIDVAGIATDKTVINMTAKLEKYFKEISEEIKNEDSCKYAKEYFDKVKKIVENFKKISESSGGGVENAKFGTNILELNEQLNGEIEKATRLMLKLIREKVNKDSRLWRCLIDFNQGTKINQYRNTLLKETIKLCRKYKVKYKETELIENGVLVGWYVDVADDREISRFILSWTSIAGGRRCYYLEELKRILMGIYCVMLSGDRFYTTFDKLISSMGSKDKSLDPDSKPGQKFDAGQSSF